MDVVPGGVTSVHVGGTIETSDVAQSPPIAQFSGTSVPPPLSPSEVFSQALVDGLTQLAKEPWMRDRRTRIAARYDEAFSRLNRFVEIPHVAAGVRPAWHLYPLRLRLEALSVDRDRFIEELEAANIGASVHFIPLHLLEHFQRRFGLRLGDFPVAEAAFERIISLPLYPSMSDGDVDDVISAVQGIVHRHVR